MDIGWKLASAGAGALASLVAGRLVDGGWKLATGRDVPHEDDDEVSILQLVVFAAVSAAVAALAQRAAVKGAKKWYRPQPLATPALEAGD